MSHVRVESSVPRNRKFLQAGPAPSWLWLCGLAYCQEGLTDGFIPDEAIDLLGVPKHARRLAAQLVRSGLWDKTEGGWRVHDYLEYNRSAAEVNGIKIERRKAGKQGGEASGEARRKQVAEANAKHSSNPYVDVGVVASEAVGELKEEGLGETQPLDVAFDAFKSLYPKERRVIGMSQRLYFDAVSAGKVTPEFLLIALRNHIASEQWQDVRHIPNMQKWFEEQRWEQVLPPPGQSRKAVDTRPAWVRNAKSVAQIEAERGGR